MSVVVYHYAGCSTCRKARKFLKEVGIEAVLIDLKAAPPSAERIAELHAASGLPVKRFFNTSGQSYRGGGFKDKLPGMSEAQACAALAADGMLIKRPILVVDGESTAVRVGFREPDWRTALTLNLEVSP